MAKVLRRRKVAPIYATAGGWWANEGGVSYVAHVVLTDGTIKPLADPASTGKNAGKSPSDHPDQKYWETVRLVRFFGQ